MMVKPQVRKWLLILLLLLTAGFARASDLVIDVQVGDHQVLLPPGHCGLNYFPDEPIGVLSTRPFSFLMTAGDTTHLMAGTSLRNATPVRPVLSPGKKGEFDNGYAGVGAAFIDKRRKLLLAFYHAEDHEGMPRVPYNPSLRGSFWSIGLAESPLSSLDLRKVGPILTPNVTKSTAAEPHLGIGDVSVTPDASNTYLYAYYTDLTRQPPDRRAKIGMARCRIADGAKPGTWEKYYQGEFREPGLGGKGSPVVLPPRNRSDVFAPHVTYIRPFKVYLMVCNVMEHSEHEKQRATEGGIYYTYSEDGIRWEKPKKLVTGHPIPYLNRQYLAHPHLVFERTTRRVSKGWLLYCFSPRWGTTAPQSPHFLCGREIFVTLNSSNAKQ